MYDSEPGLSGIKRPKMIVKNPKNLTEQEMLHFLYNSNYDEDEDYEPDTSESEPAEDDGLLLTTTSLIGRFNNKIEKRKSDVPNDVHHFIRNCERAQSVCDHNAIFHIICSRSGGTASELIQNQENRPKLKKFLLEQYGPKDTIIQLRQKLYLVNKTLTKVSINFNVDFGVSRNR
ncbi:hypothetical protein FQA39_LY02339 [Lamprigera yunnana]|nr:hypothetical protein FQA39_LY02339 [Lamprigera yunnana]